MASVIFRANEEERIITYYIRENITDNYTQYYLIDDEYYKYSKILEEFLNKFCNRKLNKGIKENWVRIDYSTLIEEVKDV